MVDSMPALPRKDAKIVVAIPVKDEEGFIEPCLRALGQQSEPIDDIVLLINNSRDRTAAIARNLAPFLPARLHVEEIALPSAEANAGTARRLAMDRAAAIAGLRGAIFTTDADGQVPAHWIGANMAWLRRGHDAVCGMAVIDPVDEACLPPNLVADDLAEQAYGTILDELDDLIDPRPWDPWPRHSHRSGASIAVRAAVFAAVGGLPQVAHSEDRGFIARLERRDCKIRHDPALSIVVSGRRLGRAEGGMAETIARRMIEQDIWADDRLEMPQAALLRSQLRRQARDAWTGHHNSRSLALCLDLPQNVLAAIMLRPWFGDAWAAIEAISPVLERRPVAMAQLTAAIVEAEPILARLRAAKCQPSEQSWTGFGNLQAAAG